MMQATATERPNFAIRTGRAFLPTLRYWLQTEVHVYAFAIAANVLLSFYPMLILMLSVCRKLLHWSAGANAITLALYDYFPPNFIQWMAEDRYTKSVTSHGKLQLASVLLLLFTANGIFGPMEVALNRAWGCTTNRSLVKNQLVSYGLIFMCGTLLMISATLTAFGPATGKTIETFASTLFFRLAAVPISILILFLIYWLLPNCPVKAGEVLPVAIVVGLVLEGLKYVSLLARPWLEQKLLAEYGYHFRYAVALVFWGFVGSLLILAGAEWSARHRRPAISK